MVSMNLAPGTSTTKTRSTKPEINKAKHSQSKETSDGFTSLIPPYLLINKHVSQPWLQKMLVEVNWRLHRSTSLLSFYIFFKKKCLQSFLLPIMLEVRNRFFLVDIFPRIWEKNFLRVLVILKFLWRSVGFCQESYRVLILFLNFLHLCTSCFL